MKINRVNLKITVTYLCIVLGMISCNEDKGNYDYETINRVDQFTNINEYYSVELGERLLITPNIVSSLGTLEDFVYKWYYRNGSTWTELAEGKDLDFVIADPIGTPNKTYTCAFEATNKNTNVPFRHVFSVKVTGTFNKGYVMLYEKEAGIEMGMVVQNSQNEFIPKYDILSVTAPELKREGVKGRDLKIYNERLAPNPFKPDNSGLSIFLLTDQYTTRLKASDFSWDSSLEISNLVEKSSPLDKNYVSVGRPVIAEKLQYNYQNGNPRTFIYLTDDDGEGYWYLNTTYPVYYFFSYPMNAYNANVSIKDNYVHYDAEPYMAVGGGSALFYNKEKKDFTYQKIADQPNTMGTDFFFSKDFVDDSQDHIFNFHDKNEGLFYMGNRFSKGREYTAFAVLKQSDGMLKFIEFQMHGNYKSESGLVNKDAKLRACIFGADTNLSRAKFIAAAPSPNNAFIYYVTEDNRMFYADVTDATAKEIEITDQVVSDGYNEITSIQFTVFNSGNNYLGVASYNGNLKDTGGKICFYEMPTSVSGDLNLANEIINEEKTVPMSWTGFGKIVAFDYKP